MEFVKDHDPYPDLRVNIGSLELQNPVMTASGTFGYAREFEELVNLHRLGGIIVKGISLEPRAGNPPQRIVETPVMMTLAQADNITSADLETEAFNAIINPNKTLVSVAGVHHMSLYTNRDHLGKVGKVQATWLKNLLDSIE